MSVSAGVPRRLRRSTVITTAVLSVAALVITGFAMRFPGLHSSEVEVSNGGVWVTSGQDGLLGRLNVDAQELDARLTMVGEDLDILQSGYTVIETGARGMTPINSAGISRGGVVELIPETEVALGNDRVVIAAPDGRVWILSPNEAAAFSPSSVDPVHETGGEQPQVAVTTEGTVFVLDGNELLKFNRADDTRDTEAEKPIVLGNLSTTDEMVSLTTVGEEPVVLDKENRLLRLGTDAKEYGLQDYGVTNFEALTLQQSSPAADDFVLATEDSLFVIPLNGGEPRITAAGGTGTPVAPALAKGCAYGAWNGSNKYVRVCEGDEEPVVDSVPEVSSGADLKLRVNHDLVVLNDQEFGLSWMIAADMQVVDDWQIQQNIQTSTTEEKEEETLTTTIENIEAERDQENRPPVANDDEFGVRPGQSVVLPVTRNDTDPDGDLLTVALQGEQPPIGTVTPIQGGTQLQIVVDEDATGSASFTYQADDGRGGTDTATVSLDVRGEEENNAPVPVDDMVTKVQVRSGEEISFNILPYWEDPDGDAFYLTGAVVQPEDVVSFRADGLITFNDAELTTGTKQVQLTFRDEKGMTAEGTLEVEAVTENDLAPITTTDHASVVAGRSTTIKPLVNDLNPNGGQLELTHVSESAGLEVDPVLEAGTLNVSGDAPGTHYLSYTVAASGASSVSTGLIRVDIIEASSEELVPVAVDDMGTVTTGTDTLIDPLQNDVDPTGGVLVVNSVEVPESSGLKATVVDHHLVRVEAEPNAAVVDEPIPLTYEVANSAGSTTGTIRVMLVQTDTQFANPTAVPDQAVVRAGDMVTVPVLENDVSPTGSDLVLGDSLTNTEAAEEQGHLETHQDQVRFTANDDATGEVELTYEAVDETGRTGSARLTLTIVPRDAPNTAPKPENLTARTVAGTEVRIPVPTTGIDADGDSVMLTGIASPTPQLGEVVSATGEWIEYRPHQDSSGTDRFRYQVMDRNGAVGTGEVVVGIAAPNEVNQPPYAVDDVVEVRPDREVQIPVLDNDTDPEGTPLSLVRADVESLSGIEVMETDDETDNLVTVTTPSEAGTHTVLYSASDGQLKSSATATIKVDPNAQLRNPIARDDFVDPADVMDPDEPEIRVDVVANDSDPDGSTQDLLVTLEDPPEGASVDDSGVVTVPPLPEQQRIRYIIEDLDGLTSAGYIWVPGTEKQAPVWVGGTLEAQAGAETTIDISDPSNVRVRPGGQPAQITDADTVSAAHSDGSQLVADAQTLVYRPAADYSGEDSISVEVTDGEVGDATASTATLTIPVRVAAEDENLPPTLQGAVLQVEQGGPQATVDMASSASDPEDDDLTFALGDVPATDGVTIGLEGSTVTAEATPQVPKGTIVDVPVTVSDGTNDPVPATVQATVGGSSRPVIATVLDEAQIDAGRTDTIDVLANDSNPFPGGNRTLLSASLVSGDGVVDFSGDSVTITPDEEFHGILTAQYTVRDDTEDPERDQSGEIRVTVRGTPEAPSAPRIGEVGDGTVELNFSAGADNGAPITGYTVTTASGPAVSQDCASTSCTITELNNDTEYTFQVTSTNDVGESDPSVPSAVARPDVRPEAPAAPSAERGDGQLTVNWSAPVNRGSAIQEYALQMRNEATGAIEARTLDAGSSQLVWEGLANGSDYSFRVQARNLADEPSDWSGWSRSEHPAGRPGKPAGTPEAERVNEATGGGVRVTWPAMTSLAETNGEDITQYIVTASSGATATVSAGTLSHRFDGLDKDSEHSFTVKGVNSVGTGPTASNASNAVTPWAVPSAPTNVRATMPSEGEGSGPNGRATVSWEPAAGNGTAIQEYVITSPNLNQPVVVDASRSSHTFTNLKNGTSYSFQVQSRNRFEGGESKLSSSSNSVRPYTNPAKPSISSTNKKCTNASTCEVSFSIAANGSDGGGGGKTLQWRLGSNDSWQDASGTSHTVRENIRSGGSLTVEARVVNGEGLSSAVEPKAQPAQTYTPPAPKFNAQWGPAKTVSPVCTSVYCRQINVQLTNLDPSKTYTLRLSTPGQGGDWGYNITVNPRADGTWSTRNDGGYDFLYGWPDDHTDVIVDGKTIGSFDYKPL
jgi:hypothetical protein